MAFGGRFRWHFFCLKENHQFSQITKRKSPSPALPPPTSLQRRPPHNRLHQLAHRAHDADDPGSLYRLLRAAGRRRPRRVHAQGVVVAQGALLLLEGRDRHDDPAAAAERGAVCVAAGSS